MGMNHTKSFGTNIIAIASRYKRPIMQLTFVMLYKWNMHKKCSEELMKIFDFRVYYMSDHKGNRLCGADHDLLVAKVRDRLTVSKQ
jgi:hypothetical protein